jgi:hypothetical protein
MLQLRSAQVKKVPKKSSYRLCSAQAKKVAKKSSRKVIYSHILIRLRLLDVTGLAISKSAVTLSFSNG